MSLVVIVARPNWQPEAEWQERVQHSDTRVWQTVPVQRGMGAFRVWSGNQPCTWNWLHHLAGQGLSCLTPVQVNVMILKSNLGFLRIEARSILPSIKPAQHSPTYVT